jgi:hypothetical protein
MVPPSTTSTPLGNIALACSLRATTSDGPFWRVISTGSRKVRSRRCPALAMPPTRAMWPSGSMSAVAPSMVRPSVLLCQAFVTLS